MEQNKLFAETPPLQLFLRAAIPGAIAMLASMLYDTADGILVGRFLGADTFAAVAISLPLVIMSFAVSDLVGVGSKHFDSFTSKRRTCRKRFNLPPCICSLPAICLY